MTSPPTNKLECEICGAPAIIEGRFCIDCFSERVYVSKEAGIKRGTITLYIGPMWGGKTTSLIRMYNRCKSIAIKHSSDSIHCDGNITSHDGLSIPAFTVTCLADLYTPRDRMDDKVNHITEVGSGEVNESYSIISKAQGIPPKDILIDEGQFFPDLASGADRLASLGHNVYIAALSGHADLSPWDSVSKVIPYCDYIKHMRGPICMGCRSGERPVSFTAIQPSKSKEVHGDGVLIAGADTYMPVCSACHSTIRLYAALPPQPVGDVVAN